MVDFKALKQVHDEKYPEHAKLRLIQEKSQAIGEFLDSMQGQGTRPRGSGFIRIFGSWRWMGTHRILAEYFGIDENKLEDEKRAMLAEIQVVNLAG